MRKGAVTHISTGTTSCPPIASICLRANWSMPGVMNRYIKYENAGDQFVGKCVSGRTRLSKEFAASPAYFDFSSCTRFEQETNKRGVDNWIKDRMPDEAKKNDKVFALFKMCIATIEYNREFLMKNLHSNSSIRTSIFLLEKAPVVEHLTVKYPWNKTSDTPEFTGIPPDILILAEFESMKIRLEEMQLSLEVSIERALKRELDARAVGTIMGEQMTAMMNRMSEVMDTCCVNKSPALPSDEIEGIFADVGFDDEEFDELVLPFVDEGISNHLIQERTACQLKERQYTIGWHHGKLNPLPSSWHYLKCLTLIQLINLWLIGVREHNVPP